MQNISTEKWKAIPGYKGFYEASDKGRIRSVDRIVVLKNGQRRKYQGRVLKPGTHEFGYKKVNLIIRGKKECAFVHRIVCKTWNGLQPSARHQVAHNDGNPENCKKENLRWCLPAENQSDRKKHGTILVRAKHPGAKLTEKQVAFIKENVKITQKSLAKKFGVHEKTISAIRCGRSWA